MKELIESLKMLDRNRKDDVLVWVPEINSWKFRGQLKMSMGTERAQRTFSKLWGRKAL